jgi:hypothetical protein
VTGSYPELGQKAKEAASPVNLREAGNLATARHDAVMFATIQWPFSSVQPQFNVPPNRWWIDVQIAAPAAKTAVTSRYPSAASPGVGGYVPTSWGAHLSFYRPMTIESPVPTRNSAQRRRDLLLIVDTPSGDNAAKFALALGSLGNVRTRTVRAWPESEFLKLISELP